AGTGGQTAGGSAIALGQRLATQFGYSPAEFQQALVPLWNQESGWNRFAKNPSSGAYGIPQALPPTKMPFAAQEAGGSDPIEQIMWGLNYIRDRYKSPSDPMGAYNAWGGYYARGGWYAKGGIFSRPTIIGVGEAGPEAVVPLNKGFGASINVYVSGNVVTERQLVDAIYEGLQKKGKRNPLALPV
ncbi:MAG TPA: transglycosylase SLT domain-containing protein, partial [Nitrososphaera sp.]